MNQSEKQVKQSLNRSFKELKSSEAISSSHLSPSTTLTRMSSMSSFKSSVDEHSKKSLIKEKALKSTPSFNRSEERSNMLKERIRNSLRIYQSFIFRSFLCF